MKNIGCGVGFARDFWAVPTRDLLYSIDINELTKQLYKKIKILPQTAAELWRSGAADTTSSNAKPDRLKRW
jgi:hypothetical protein